MRVFFFFFKQKTAYEMRISDWSSDVCSSDLGRLAVQSRSGALGYVPHVRPPGIKQDEEAEQQQRQVGEAHRPSRNRCWRHPAARARRSSHPLVVAGASSRASASRRASAATCQRRSRSEEHTSELQSLMRISYAVFCLKKKHIHKK